jgi:hypothetical protein
MQNRFRHRFPSMMADFPRGERNLLNGEWSIPQASRDIPSGE